MIAGADIGTKPLFKSLKVIHSGLGSDYVLWIIVGLAVFSGRSSPGSQRRGERSGQPDQR